ncbi:acyl-CoA dehydrogenase family protein, partial [Nocardioides sp. NPDC057767]|uniref:acyl-CoA dehydrogenase family protein n=1 Tax=Nocardioides sp. NPDC057767 TaxID=3346244 RepID=UPI00366EC9AD
MVSWSSHAAVMWSATTTALRGFRDPPTYWRVANRHRLRDMSAEYPLFALSEEHQEIRKAIREICDAKIAPAAAAVDEEARYPQEAHDALV